jgi:transcriptional regulator with XRE-family HTH domain
MKEQIEGWREREGLSQKEAGEALGLSQPEYSRLERGTKKPSHKVLKRLLELGSIEFIDTPQNVKEKVETMSPADQEMVMEMVERLCR